MTPGTCTITVRNDGSILIEGEFLSAMFANFAASLMLSGAENAMKATAASIDSLVPDHMTAEDAAQKKAAAVAGLQDQANRIQEASLAAANAMVAYLQTQPKTQLVVTNNVGSLHPLV